MATNVQKIKNTPIYSDKQVARYLRLKTRDVEAWGTKVFGHKITKFSFGAFVAIANHFTPDSLDWIGNPAEKVKIFPRVSDRNLKIVSLDLTVAFGSPVIDKIGVRTDVIASRFLGGDSVDDLVTDYGCDRVSIEEAIRFEFWQPEE